MVFKRLVLFCVHTQGCKPPSPHALICTHLADPPLPRPACIISVWPLTGIPYSHHCRKTCSTYISEKANSPVNMSAICIQQRRANIVSMHEIKFSYGCNSYLKSNLSKYYSSKTGEAKWTQRYKSKTPTFGWFSFSPSLPPLFWLTLRYLQQKHGSVIWIKLFPPLTFSMAWIHFF